MLTIIRKLLSKLLSKNSIFQFAVLCEARANSGLDKMKIINVVAKAVPEPHKVDLSNPDRTIVVQIAKVNPLS